MVNTLEKPAQWQSEYFVAWVGEADHEAALAQPNGWLGPIAETLKTQGHYAQVSLLCGGDVQRTEQYREWLLAQTTYSRLWRTAGPYDRRRRFGSSDLLGAVAQ
jgi:hypothetical protein